MREWIRVPQSVFCGCCGELIEKGQPALVLHSNPPGRWKSHRCGQFACAREAIPELPPLAARPPTITPQPILRVGADMLPLDFKTRQGGE